ncbi:N-acetyltransferase GCN5 [Desulfolithobacter dissulfuricans]|uniref:N-acetyltransferase GCN5 n=1 Tax=Desulfolithobacter dissulfuricans TaxID=2795293 RepID=A0A915XLG1_9BACT|nr:GNAT family N-acetyltransferase [Desulfolithobacter dissulfuricans]BCO09731.1 N-acetyltransferase GCN5 [Desulfolithobacter dissulfuricans]
MGEITAPEPITSAHILADFDCGVSSLNDWLKRQALKNEVSGASRTFVACKDLQVIGFYALAAGSVIRRQAPGKSKRKMPEPIPVMVLGRLAVDFRWQKNGIGRGLLKDAVLRTIQAAKYAGMRALVVHALSEESRKFYLRHGFLESPLNQFTLMLPSGGVKI